MLTREHPSKPSFHLIKLENDKFFTKLLSKESAEPSFRVYHDSLSGSVPFFWESQPGTPKHRLDEIAIPPLTPPPSYHLNSKRSSSNSSKKSSLLNSKSNILRILFLKARRKKSSGADMAADVDGAFVFPSLTATTTTTNSLEKLNGRRRFSSRGSSSSSDSSMTDGDRSVDEFPASSLCFRAMRWGSVGQRGAVWPW